ncbi:hypothetical protein TCDM_12343 [Trypanosoma cruzi Dm28c]|uniref:Uncharacterized protein n=1 Tax=Trypanosoma cruzi Dm28c TaxID=1416333 RepID=V5AE50_TRYCR|nr:hypothetical protein TCDM_12343 [Trypanosoma cruzi Dm28c]
MEGRTAEAHVTIFLIFFLGKIHTDSLVGAHGKQGKFFLCGFSFSFFFFLFYYLCVAVIEDVIFQIFFCFFFSFHFFFIFFHFFFFFKV